MNVFFFLNMVLCEHKQEEKIMLTIQEMMNNLTTSCPEGTKIMTSNKNPACFLHENQLMNKMIFDKSINEESCARSMFFVFFYLFSMDISISSSLRDLSTFFELIPILI